MAAPKKYGLILPKGKQQAGSSQKVVKNVFGDESSEDEHDKATIESMIKKEAKRNLSKVSTQLALQKAMTEDPTIFEYDEVYDDMKQKKEAQDIANKVISKDKKPKYIDRMLKNAELRKREDDRRTQRKIQAERQAENDEFGDKESFVTSAYKKKMEEMKEEEERLKVREQIEEMMDVTKQKDLSGFYRHLLKQQVGEEKVPENTDEVLKIPEELIKKEAPDTTNKPSGSGSPKSSEQKAKPQSKKVRAKIDNPDEDSDFIESSSSEESSEEVKDFEKKKNTTRTYRKRKQQSDSEDEPLRKKGNDDADTSDSGSSSSDEEDAEEDKKENIKSEIKEEPQAPVAPPPKKKDWKEMFTKRCVGVLFEEAQARYFQRKALRDGVGIQ